MLVNRKIKETHKLILDVGGSRYAASEVIIKELYTYKLNYNWRIYDASRFL